MTNPCESSKAVEYPPPPSGIAYPKADYSMPQPEDENNGSTPGALFTPISLNFNKDTLPSHLQELTEAKFNTMLPAIVKNLRKEMNNLSTVPCLVNSFCYGLIAGGIVGGIGMYYSRKLSYAKYGLLTFLGFSIASWEFCRFKIRMSIREGYTAMHNIQRQIPRFQSNLEATKLPPASHDSSTIESSSSSSSSPSTQH